jgi:tripartite ATP-independent transporter DctP family solute receptor
MKGKGCCKWVEIAVFILIILVALPMAGLAAEISLKLGHVAPPGSIYDVASNKFAELVAANTKGRVEIKVFSSSQLGSPPEHWALLKTGAMDLFPSETGVASVAEPEPKNINVVKAPYIFESQAQFLKFIRSDLLKTMYAKVEKANGIKYIGYFGNCPPRSFSTTNKRVETPDDIKGLKLRVPPEPIFVAVYKAWGANPTPVAPKEVYTSLKSGLVDGMDQNIVDLYLGKYYEIQKFYIAIDYLYSGLGCWINGKRWESFPEDIKSAFLKSVEETEAYVNKFVVKQVSEAEEAFKAAGVEIIRPDLRPWKEIAEKESLKNDGILWEKGLYEKVKAIK